MEAAALEKIIGLAIAASDRNVLKEHTPALVLNNQIVSIEHLKDRRSRFRGAYSTTVLGEFISYVSDANPDGTTCFVDAEAMSAQAIMNLGDATTPGHADWTASLKLKPSAPFAAALKRDGVACSQRELAEWIEDWLPHMGAIGPAGTVMEMATAVRAIREITISQKKDQTHGDRDFGASKSSMEEIEAKSRFVLPSKLMFICTPYIGFNEIELSMRVSVITGDTPKMTLRIIGLEQVIEDLALEFRNMLSSGLKGLMPVCVGTFRP
jgi:uncharacterized protein YfdQ (DUF2303 family)